MVKQNSEKIDREIDRYQNALRYFALGCDWESFESKAAKLFEYLEATEVLLLKRKFHRTVAIILIVLVTAFACISTLGSIGVSFFLKFRTQLALIILAGCFYELMLLLEFNVYLHVRLSRQKMREDRFIRGIEDDAKAFVRRGPCISASS